MTVPERVRQGLQLVWAWLLLATGCVWWAKRQLSRRNAVLVLTFHRVLDRDRIRAYLQPAWNCSAPSHIRQAGRICGPAI